MWFRMSTEDMILSILSVISIKINMTRRGETLRALRWNAAHKFAYYSTPNGDIACLLATVRDVRDRALLNDTGGGARCAQAGTFWAGTLCPPPLKGLCTFEK